MLQGKILENFCELCLKVGVNLQVGQGLEIACPVEKSDIAQALSLKAYALGARMVHVRWEDDEIDRISYENAETEALTDIPKWFIDSKNYLLEKNFCYVAIAAENPSAFKDISTEKLAAVTKKRSVLLKKFSEAVMSNGIRWCVVSVPTKAWAEQVFPNSKNPEADLSTAIEKTMRLNFPDPAEEWRSHIERLNKRAEYLNGARFSYLKFTNSLGTDLKVGLCDNHVWLSAQEKAKDGVNFVANMPTEEVFTAPHREKTEGIVKSALPLSYNGQLIDNFSLTFKKGKVVNFSAEKGYEALKRLIFTDNGTKRLGEVALIGKNSPIFQSGILFYNTLFDENASCHIALGKAYPTCVKNGEKLSASQLKTLGANDSVEHIDFMFGTPDLCVTGINADGSEITLFTDGEWTI